MAWLLLLLILAQPSWADPSPLAVHVLVVLADNEHQGIVPVPPRLGNGQKPGDNLYWGARYGVQAYFQKSKQWKLVRSEKSLPPGPVLERLVFKHRKKNAYLMAEAYDGRNMRDALVQQMMYLAGRDPVRADGVPVAFGGEAKLVAFVGHNGLMDFSLRESELPARSSSGQGKEAIVLAGASKRYFGSLLKRVGAHPLLWTTNLMAPEAYILHDALEAWLKRQKNERVREQAALAYAKYQRISKRAARSLLVTGF